MNNKVTINIIIPVYNTEEHIEKCLESLVKQTFTDWHAAIVDDGSTDNSTQICKYYCDKYNGKFTYFRKEHEGPGEARNYGLNHINSSEYLYFLDSDDFLEEEALEKMVNAARKNNVQMVVCGYILHKRSTKRIFGYRQGLIDRKEFCCALLNNESIENYVWNKLFSYEVFKNLRFPASLYEDISTVYKAALNCDKIYVINEVLYNYVYHKGSIVASNNLQYLSDFKKAVTQRNDAITQIYPELQDLANVNKLKADIYIWSEIMKKNLSYQNTEFENCILEIKKSKKLYSELDFFNRMVVNIVNYCPGFYRMLLTLKKILLWK